MDLFPHSSFETNVEGCSPASTDGGVVPDLVPIPKVDPDAVEDAAARLLRIGEAIADGGADIKATWASLSGVYVAPESEQLLEVVDPVADDTAEIEGGVTEAANALNDFAETVRPLKVDLISMKEEAVAVRERIDADEDWLDDEDLREDNNDLNTRISTTVQDYQDAERECANRIGEKYGGTLFTAHSHKRVGDQTSTNEDARDRELYGSTLPPKEQSNPWGGQAEEPSHFLVDGFWGIADIVTGAAISAGAATGVWKDGQAEYPLGTEQWENTFAYGQEWLHGVGDLTGFWVDGERVQPESADEWWGNVRGPLFETFDSVVPVSEFEDRPAYTITQGAANVVMLANPLGWIKFGLEGPTGGDVPDSVPLSESPNFHNDSGGGSGGGFGGTDTVSIDSGGPSTIGADDLAPVGAMNDSLGELGDLVGGQNPSGDSDGSAAPWPDLTPEAPSQSTTESANPSDTTGAQPAPESQQGADSGTSSHNDRGSGQEGSHDSASQPRSEGESGGGNTDTASTPQARSDGDPTARELADHPPRTPDGSPESPWTASPTADGAHGTSTDPSTGSSHSTHEGAGGSALREDSGTSVRDADASEGRSNGTSDPGGGHGSGNGGDGGIPPTGHGDGTGSSGDGDRGSGDRSDKGPQTAEEVRNYSWPTDEAFRRDMERLVNDDRSGVFEEFYQKNGHRKDQFLRIDVPSRELPMLAGVNDRGPWVLKDNLDKPPNPQYVETPRPLFPLADGEKGPANLNDAAVERAEALSDWHAAEDRLKKKEEEFLRSGEKDPSQDLLDLRKEVSTKQGIADSKSESFGELVAEHAIKEHFPEAQLLDKPEGLPGNGNDQFDQIWDLGNGEYMIVEAKGSLGTGLNSRKVPGSDGLPKLTSQGTYEYLESILNIMEERGRRNGTNEYKIAQDILGLIKSGQTSKMRYFEVRGRSVDGFDADGERLPQGAYGGYGLAEYDY